ncbi:hypothetical protein Q3G72_016090 [Acer saccharum]|nr:hypothetical protein Q3G72_016090 [Acer saccharum]
MVDGKAIYPFGPWLRAPGPIRNVHFQDPRSLSFAPVSGGGFWKTASRRDETQQKLGEGEDVAVVSNDVCLSRAEPSGCLVCVQSSGHLMEAEQKEHLLSELGSMHDDSGTQLQMEVAGVLMSNGTDRGVFNAREVEIDTCKNSIIRDGEMGCGPSLSGQVFPSPCLSQPMFKKDSGCDSGPSGSRFRRLKVGGQRVHDPVVEVGGSSGTSSALLRGKRKIAEVGSIVGLDVNKSRRIGVSRDEGERDCDSMGSAGVTGDLGFSADLATHESAGRPSSVR